LAAKGRRPTEHRGQPDLLLLLVLLLLLLLVVEVSVVVVVTPTRVCNSTHGSW
jgi:hypothetical protein